MEADDGRGVERRTGCTLLFVELSKVGVDMLMLAFRSFGRTWSACSMFLGGALVSFLRCGTGFLENTLLREKLEILLCVYIP